MKSIAATPRCAAGPCLRCSTWLLTGLLFVLASPGYAAEPACEHRAVAVYRDFAGAAFADCEFTEDGLLRLTIAPEDRPINPSPWFAFRIVSTRTEAALLPIEIDYGAVKHRYLPDLSRDGENWRPLDESALALSDDDTRARFSVTAPSGATLYIAAQPLLTAADYREWLERLEEKGSINVDIIGWSPGDRPLWRLVTPARAHTLLLLGRQHPPETTGALAMMAFVERLLASDSLAREFREEVGIVAYPFLNPDGVARGHWRHNLGSQDLNRDWGPFTQPETRQVAQDIDRYLQTTGSQLIKSIDFHSTWYEVFYTQEDASAPVLPDLLGDWMAEFSAAMASRKPDFALNRKPSHNADRPTAKSYFFERYGVSSTTLEIGDATSPDYIAGYAATAAETFMRAWLAP